MLLRLSETLNALQVTVFFFFLKCFCKLCPEYRSLRSSSSSSCFSANFVRNIGACVLLLLPHVFLQTLSGISEPANSGIPDLAITRRAKFFVNSSSHQKTDSAISNHNSGIRRRLSL